MANAFSLDDLAAMLKEFSEHSPRNELLMSAGFRRGLEQVAEGFITVPAARTGAIGTGRLTELCGIRVVQHDIPPEIVEDWSECRSPARAKRRAKRGHPQRMKLVARERAFLIDMDMLKHDYEQALLSAWQMRT